MVANQPSLLHITNGDGAANIIAACGLGEELLPWRDPMHHGPFLAGLNLDEQSRIRIDYLNAKQCSIQESLKNTEPHDFSARNAALANSPNYNEVVLWFEHDLLDQLQILQLLDWFAQANMSNTKLSLICIDNFNGVDNFRGLGQLTPEQMESLFEHRQPVTSVQLTLAQRYWSVFCLDEPQTLLNLLSENSTSEKNVTPYMQAALMRHCQEYPWSSDGITRTERQLLTMVEQGVTKPVSLFVQNMKHETHLYIGDWRTYSHIAELCAAAQPLLRCLSGEQFWHPRNSTLSTDEFNEQALAVTDYGKRVLDGSANAADTLERNSWLGGVHLNSDATIWFWDDQRQLFEPRTKKAGE